MKKRMKEELTKHSYLTMSRNQNTAEQLIKKLELNGNCVDASSYTADPKKDYKRKILFVRILQNLFKELNFKNWFDIEPESVDEWIQKLQQLSPAEMAVHKVFRPDTIDQEIKDI